LFKYVILIPIDKINVTYYYEISKTFSNIPKEKGLSGMGTIVCQTCNATIDHFEDEKVTVLYGQCSGCDCEDEE